MGFQLWVRPLVLVGVLVLGVLAEARSYGTILTHSADYVVGVVFVVAGVTLPVARRLETALFVATAASWFVGTMLPMAAFWHRGFLVHLLIVLAWGARLPRPAWFVSVAGYGAVLAGAVWSSDLVSTWAALGWAAGVLAVIHPAPSSRRRLIAMSSVATLTFAVVAGAVVRMTGWSSAGLVALVLYDIVLAAIGVTVWQALRSPRLGSLVDAVVELGAPGSEVRDRLAALLDDPTLDIGYPDGGSGGFINAEGRLIDRVPEPDRVVREIAVEDVPVALLVHRATVLDADLLDRAVLTAVRVRDENARLARESAAHLGEVVASRSRVATAAAQERRRFGRELHGMVTFHLAGLAPTLPTERSRDLLARATVELERLAAGLTPTVLDGGLPAALRMLADDCVLPVELETVGLQSGPIQPDDDVAQCVYYVCAEALANAVRHGDEGRIAIRVRVLDAMVELDVTNPARDAEAGRANHAGSGLIGLKDRVEVLGGTFTAGPTTCGFRLGARLPARAGGAGVSVSS